MWKLNELTVRVDEWNTLWWITKSDLTTYQELSDCKDQVHAIYNQHQQKKSHKNIPVKTNNSMYEVN